MSPDSPAPRGAIRSPVAVMAPEAPAAQRLSRRAWAHAAAQLAIAVAIAVGWAAAFPATAHAEVRKADVVAGSTVEERGLSVSQSPSITADFAALVSADGEVYFSRAGSERSQIASITKVMTAIVALDRAPDGLRVKVSADAAEIGESSANLLEGDVMTLEAALKALLVPSGNDAAVAIAEAVGAALPEGGSASGADAVRAFVDAMNAKAAELGLEDTLYENPHGLDDGEYAGDLHSTALDQAKVARCAMGYRQIRDIVAGGSTSIEVERAGTTEKVDLETTDLLLEMYDHAIGVKTGVTDSAGPSFMGAASKDGREMYAVVLGCDDEYTRFEDAETLFEWAYEHIVDLPLANTARSTSMRADGVSREVPVIAEVSHREWIDRTVKATFPDPDATARIFDLEGNVSQSVEFEELTGAVEVGQKVGRVTFYQRNRVIASEELVACERVEAPNPIDTVAIWWQRLTQGLGDEGGRASSLVYNVMPVINDNTSSAA